MACFTAVNQQRHARCRPRSFIFFQFNFGAWFNGGALACKVLNVGCAIITSDQPIALG